MADKWTFQLRINPFTPRLSYGEMICHSIFFSVDKILSCYHSNETSLAELLHNTTYFLGFYETKYEIFGEFFALATLGVKELMAILSRNNYLISAVVKSLGLLVITVAYFQIFRVVRHHHNQIQMQNGQALEKSALRAFYVYFLRPVCYLPTLFASFPLIVDNFKGSFLLAFYITPFFVFLNSSLNLLFTVATSRDSLQRKKRIEKIFHGNSQTA